jgi:hypothetical protein
MRGLFTFGRSAGPLAPIVVSMLLGGAGTARAAEVPERAPGPAPRGAFELGIAAGFSQGTGKFSRAPGDAVNDTARAGGAVDLEAGIRLAPHVSIGAYGGYAQFARSQLIAAGTQVRSMTFGVQGQYHFDPDARLDPWIGLGAGYRVHAVSPDRGPDYLRHGLTLARVRVGIDWRLSRAVAIGPVLGADLNLFMWQRPAGGETVRLDAEYYGIAPFFFGGLAGRFDAISGRAERTGSATASAR